MIFGNTTVGDGGGIAFANHSDPIVAYNSITGNTAGKYGEGIIIAVEGGQSSVVVEKGCTLNWGDGMIDNDPLFMTFKGDDYLLDVGSPCIDTGDPSIENAISDWHPRWSDWLPNGPRSDMGAYGGPGNKGWVQ